jgi:hypothetical protein
MSFWELYKWFYLWIGKQEIEELISASVRANISTTVPQNCEKYLARMGIWNWVIGSESKQGKSVPEEEWIRDLKRKELTDISGSIVFITTELDAYTTLAQERTILWISVEQTHLRDVRNDVCAFPKTMTTRRERRRISGSGTLESLKPFSQKRSSTVNSDRSPICRICFSSHSLEVPFRKSRSCVRVLPVSSDASCFTLVVHWTGDQVLWIGWEFPKHSSWNSKDLACYRRLTGGCNRARSALCFPMIVWKGGCGFCRGISESQERIISTFSLDEEHRINLYTTLG